MKWNIMEWNKNAVPLFGYFIMEQNKNFILCLKKDGTE